MQTLIISMPVSSAFIGRNCAISQSLSAAMPEARHGIVLAKNWMKPGWILVARCGGTKAAEPIALCWPLNIEQIALSIVDLAKRELDCLRRLLGAWGETLWHFAKEKSIDDIRSRFGRVQRCSMLIDKKLTGLNPKADHVIHPVSYFK